jgi:hypothetical protein
MLKVRTAVLDGTLDRDHRVANRSRSYPYLHDVELHRPHIMEWPAPRLYRVRDTIAFFDGGWSELFDRGAFRLRLAAASTERGRWKWDLIDSAHPQAIVASCSGASKGVLAMLAPLRLAPVPLRAFDPPCAPPRS